VKGLPIVEWALLVAALWLLGGAVGLVVAAAFVVYDLVREPAPRDLQVIAILLLGLVPLVVVARGLPAAAAIGTDFVQGNLVAHHLAGAGLVLLVVGVLREVRAEASASAEAPAAEPDREVAR
jgi:protein-S-isoprenylcysteine O-methyltransferase Ste14